MQNGTSASRKALRPLPALAFLLALAACGSGGPSGPAATTAARPASVSTLDHPELGPILVDTTGRTLYFAEQERDGTIKCVEECLGFWSPAEAPARPPAVPGVTGLGVLHRGDNDRDQLTYHGKPLYTFQLDDKRGEASGDNLSDAFNGTYFTWHAAMVSDSAEAPSIGY
jgi:predicted lipoprotein with Yx(FWY)xxD motif